MVQQPNQWYRTAADCRGRLQCPYRLAVGRHHCNSMAIQDQFLLLLLKHRTTRQHLNHPNHPHLICSPRSLAGRPPPQLSNPPLLQQIGVTLQATLHYHQHRPVFPPRSDQSPTPLTYQRQMRLFKPPTSRILIILYHRRRPACQYRSRRWKRNYAR